MWGSCGLGGEGGKKIATTYEMSEGYQEFVSTEPAAMVEAREQSRGKEMAASVPNNSDRGGPVVGSGALLPANLSLTDHHPSARRS